MAFPRIVKTRTIILVAVGLLLTMAVAVPYLVTLTAPEPPKDRSDFAGPLAFDPRKGEHSRQDLPRTFSRKISISGAVSEYADLTGRSDKVPVLFWLRSDDNLFRRFLRKTGITHQIESACKVKLPPGSIEFARQQSNDVTLEPKSMPEDRVSLSYETAGIYPSSWIQNRPVIDSDRMVRESPALRVLNLWAALRNEGVELRPVGTDRIRAIWHRTGSPKPL